MNPGSLSSRLTILLNSESAAFTLCRSNRVDEPNHLPKHNSGMGSFQRRFSLNDLPNRLATDIGEGLVDRSPAIRMGKGRPS